MRSLITSQAKTLSRAYWQYGVLALLFLLVFSQMVSWGMTYFELRRVDAMIASAANPVPISEKSESDGNQSTPPTLPVVQASGGRPGSSSSSSEEKKPAKNIFRKENIPYQLSAIFMDVACIDGKYVKVGDRVGKAVVKEISSTTVSILEDGKDQPRQIELFKGASGSSGARASSSGRPAVKPQPGGTISLSGQASNTNPSERENISNMSIDEIRSRIGNMSPQERQARFESMSEEERQQLRERFGGMRGGGGNIGGGGRRGGGGR